MKMLLLWLVIIQTFFCVYRLWITTVTSLLMQGWHHAISMCKSQSAHWALYAKSVLDRTRLALASKAEWYLGIFQPSAEYLGSLLGVDQWAVCY